MYLRRSPYIRRDVRRFCVRMGENIVELLTYRSTSKNKTKKTQELPKMYTIGPAPGDAAAALLFFRQEEAPKPGDIQKI
jgi:hypothetical protein